jgi:hypothetical protein
LLFQTVCANRIVELPQDSAPDRPCFSTGGETVGLAGDQDVLENLEPDAPAGGQFLPSAIEKGHAGSGAGPASDDEVARFREDLRKLAANLDAVDRRDAAQHGGLKGEIAHLVRRIARLEAIPRPRPGR